MTLIILITITKTIWNTNTAYSYQLDDYSKHETDIKRMNNTNITESKLSTGKVDIFRELFSIENDEGTRARNVIVNINYLACLFF